MIRVMAVFGAAWSHYAHLFVDRRGNRIAVQMHDSLSICSATGCLH